MLKLDFPSSLNEKTQKKDKGFCNVLCCRKFPSGLRDKKGVYFCFNCNSGKISIASTQCQVIHLRGLALDMTAHDECFHLHGQEHGR